MFHDTRRYSPSVIDCSPAASCLAITPATSRSSIALKASASISSRARRSRAALSAGVRRRLPTWSARKGGIVRWVIGISTSFLPLKGGGRKRSGWGSVNSAIALNPENDPHPKPRPSMGRVSSTTPHLLGNLHDHPQFGPLFVLGEDVAFFGRGEAALRRQAQLIQRDI